MDLSSFLGLWQDSEIYQILGITLLTTLTSTLISTVLGLLLAWVLASKQVIGRSVIDTVFSAMMGLPPVVAGLIVFMILSRSGPLGSMHLLYTPAAMVIAQVLLVTPVITTLAKTAMSQKMEAVHETAAGLRLSTWRERRLLLLECKPALVSALLAGFGRAISEVGAVMIVGGNIQYKTRVLTSAIVLETGKGNYDMALTLGALLLLISLTVNILLARLRREK